MQIKIKQDKKPITGPEPVAEMFRSILKCEDEIDQSKEHFWVAGLDTTNCVQYVELVSLGTLTQNLVHPREVFRLAVLKGVNSIIIGHNHPSGSIEPSKNDLDVTHRLVKAGKILGVEVLDHVIIGEQTFYSFNDQGLMKKEIKQ